MQSPRGHSLIALFILAATSALAAPSKPRAKPVVTDHTKVDRIEVTVGELGDHGAGVGRWAARTLDMCVAGKSVKRGTAKVTVANKPEQGRETFLSVAGPDDLRSCLEGRRTALIWTKPDDDVTVTLRVTVTP